MKKKIFISSGVLAIIIAVAIGMYSTNVSQAAPTLSHEEVKSLITSQYPGTITELELDREDNMLVYEIEIENDEMEYELKVDANSGEIIKLKEKKIRNNDVVKENEQKKETEKVAIKEETNKQDNTKKQTNEQTTKSSNNQANNQQQTKIESKVVQKESTEKQNKEKQKSSEKGKKTIIDRERAIQIALAEFPGKVEDVELDEEDGRLIYEIEIENGDQEAEFEIDAMTGEIIVIEIDD